MKPGDLSDAAAARRARFEQLKRQVTPAQAQNMAALSRENPSLGPGLLLPAALGGVAAGTATSRALGEGDAKVKAENGGIGGFFGKVYRGAKKVGGAVLPDAVGDSVNAVAPVIKGASRGITGFGEGFGEAVQGSFRQAAADGDITLSDVAKLPDRFGKNFTDNTKIGLLAQQVRDGGLGKVDVGSGFFLGGKAAADQKRIAYQQANMTIKGQGRAVTIGRYFANEVGLEPGNKAFNIVSGLADASVSLGVDPTSYASIPTKGLQARRLFAGNASRGFDAAGAAAKVDRGVAEAQAIRSGGTADDIAEQMGAMRGLRNTVVSDRALEWLTVKPEGRRVVDYLAKETDVAALYDATKGKLDPKLMLALAKREMTGDEVIDLLGPELGMTARLEKKFDLDAVAKREIGAGGLGTVANAAFRRKARDVRIFGTVPERVLPKNDLPEQLKQVDAFMRNAKIDRAERAGVFTKFIEADGGPGMYEATRDLMEKGMVRAGDEGIDRDRARDLFRIFEDSESGRAAYWQNLVVSEGESAWFNKQFGRVEDAERLDDGTLRAMPHLAAQFFDGNIPLPDPRAIRAEISKFKGVLKTPGLRPSLMAMEKIADNVFKPLVLLRPAYIARNQIDEQFRPAAVGLDSLMSDPVSYIQWLMTDQKGVGRVLSRASGGRLKSRGATFGPDGTDFFDEGQAKIRAAQDAVRDAKRTGDQAVVDEARKALAATKDEIQSITPYTDGVSEFMRSQTGGMGNWRNESFAQANGRARFQLADPSYARATAEGLHMIYADELARRIASGEDLAAIKADWWGGKMAKQRTLLAKNGPRMQHVLDEVGAEQYVDDTAEFIKQYLGDSPELRKAAETGRVGGSVPLADGDTTTISKAALDEINRLKEVPGFKGPQSVLGANLIRGATEPKGGYRKVVDSIFYNIADRPTRYLTKSPIFRQRYYKRAENMIGFMSVDAADEMIESARKANLKPSDIRRMERKKTASGPQLTWAEADLVAKTDALEFTADLLYDLHNRGQFFDVTRLLFPFGEAFLDSAKKYSQVTANNPVLPYRLGQVIQGSRDVDIHGDGQGFMYTDEQSGEEMFAWPGSDTLLDSLGMEGANGLRSPLKNLNILGTTVIPGFGPGVQISAAYLLPDDADFNGIRELISPFGDRTLEGGAAESFLPAWINKLRTTTDLASPSQQKSFLNAQKDMMGYLASTGEYDMSQPADIQRLQDEARVKARHLFWIRGMAQAILPSPPSPQFVAKDKDGNLLTQFKLASEYKRIQEEQDALGTPESTNRIFIETFGEDAVLATIANTKEAKDISTIPYNKRAREFLQNNRAAAERFPAVFGLFAPDSLEGEAFDQVQYQQDLRSGRREVISPDEAVRRANQRVARMIYTNAQKQVGDDPTKQQRQALSDLKGLLAEDYPGYSSSFTNDTPKLLEDLKRAAQDPKLGKTEAGQGLQIWLKAREAAETGAQSRYGVSWTQADRARPIRDSMRNLADELSKDFPGFVNIYERALEREMVKD